MEPTPSKAIEVTIPYPPSANRYWRMFRGRMTVSAEAKAYKMGVRCKLLAAGFRPQEGEVSVCVDIYRPARKGDLDNCLKVLLDSLSGVVWVDDSQIVEIVAKRFEGKERPRAELRIEFIGA